MADFEDLPGSSLQAGVTGSSPVISMEPVKTRERHNPCRLPCLENLVVFGHRASTWK